MKRGIGASNAESASLEASAEVEIRQILQRKQVAYWAYVYVSLVVCLLVLLALLLRR